MSESRQKLYNALSQKFDLGSFQEFDGKMNNPESRKKLYDAVSQTFDLGDFKTFETKIAPQPARQQQPQAQKEPPPSIARTIPMQRAETQTKQPIAQTLMPSPRQIVEENIQGAKKIPTATILEGRKRETVDVTQPFAFPAKPTTPKPKVEKYQAPATWQQATDIALTETTPNITIEQFQKKRQAEQPFTLGSMLKSDRQKAFEQENEMLKRYADAYDFNANQAANNFQTRFGIAIDAANQIEQDLQPYITKANQINSELKAFELQFEQASAITDEAKRTAEQDRITAQFNVKANELSKLESQYRGKLDTYRLFENSPEYSIYKDLKGKSTEAKNRRAQLPLDERYKDVTQDIGELEGLANAYTRGMQNAEIADILAAGRQPTTEELRRIAQLKREQEGYKVSDAVERFNNASGFKESAKAFLSNPLEITSQWVTESLVAQVSHGITRAGAGAGMGAAIGSAIPVVGTVAGAGTGFIAGMGMAGFNLEYSSSILESLQEAGVDITNEESLVNGFSDANKMKQAKEFALKRGVPIAVFDMVTGGIGSKIAKAPIKSAFKKGVAEFGTEMVGAGGGEVAAQLISKGEISGKEVFAEIMGEIGAGAPTVAVNNLVALKEKASKLKGKEKTEVEAQIVQEAVNTDVSVDAFNEVVDLHEGAGLIEPQAADELKSQYEQAQANKPVKTMQDELQVGDTVEMSPEVTAPTKVVAEEQPITEPINIQENAIQEQTADEGVLRQERPELGLQEVEQGNAKQEGVTQEGKIQEQIKPVTDEKAKETKQEPMLGGVRDGGKQEEEGKESTQLRTEEEKIDATAKALEGVDDKALIDDIKNKSIEANYNVDRFVESKPTGRKDRFANNINEFEATNPFTNEKKVFKKKTDAVDYVIKEIAKATTTQGKRNIIAEAYHKAKAEGVENDLTRSVEELLGKKAEPTPQSEVEATAKALEGVGTQPLKKQLGIEANWDMIGEGDALSGKDPVLAYTQKQLPDWNRESQKGNINPNSKITYDIVRGKYGGIDQKDIVEAKDENGVTIGIVKLDDKGGIEHIAVAPEFRGKGVADKLIQTLKDNNPQLDLSKTKLISKGFEKAFGNKIISEAYHKAKADGSNPELVKAVEELLTPKIEQNAIQEQTADEGVLRQERPELGLQEVEQGNVKQEGVAQEGKIQEQVKPVTDEKAKETKQEPMLGGVRDGGKQEEGGQESSELRAEKEEVEATAKALEGVGLPKSFLPDDRVILKTKDGQEVEVSFRGYNGDEKAVIFGDRGSGIGQMQVDISQIRAKTKSDKLTTKERNELLSKIDLNNTKYKGIGLQNVSDQELIDLSISNPLYNKLSEKEKSERQDYTTAIKPLDKYLQQEYGGDDASLNKRLTEERQDAINRIVKNPKYSQQISESYHKAKADGSNPELVKAVEELLSQATPLQTTQESKAITEPVQEERFTVNKTEYIKRGDEYFSKPNRGKEKPITKAVFDRAKQRQEKKILPIVKKEEKTSTFEQTKQQDMTAQQLPAQGALTILPSDSEETADLTFRISQKNNYYTLWVLSRYTSNGQPRTAYSYVTILSQDLDEAREKATEYLQRLSMGEQLKNAFTTDKMALENFRNAKTAKLSEEILPNEQINELKKSQGVPVEQRKIGFGKYANLTVSEVLEKDLDYAGWLANAASGNSASAWVADLIKKSDEYRQYIEEKEFEGERIKAFEEREEKRKKGEVVPVSTLVRGEKGIEEVQEDIPQPKVEKKERRLAKEQVADIVAPKATTDNVRADLKPNMFQSQIDGANAAIESMTANNVFLNGDGAGVGKTRQIIAVADHFASKGKPVIIVSENAAIGKPWENKKQPTLGGSMAKDSQEMGVNLELLEGKAEDGKIYVTTYNRIKQENVPVGAVVIFDESQNLANTFGRDANETADSEKKEWQEKFQIILSRVSATAYYSATPADKPNQFAYLHKVLGYETSEDFLEDAVKNGVVVKARKYGWKTDYVYDVPYGIVAKRKLYEWVNAKMMEAGKKGTFIKREISYEGTDVQFHDVQTTDNEKNPFAVYFESALDAMSDAEKMGYRLLAPNSYILYAAELAKIGEAIKLAKREIGAGRKVVLFVSRIKPMEIRGKMRESNGEWGDPVVVGQIESPVDLIKQELNKAGISFVELHGQSKQTSQKAQKAFNEDAQVLLASLESGGTGINLDDTTGESPRTEIFMFSPYRGISTIQGMGRIWRASTIQNDNKPNRFVFVTASDIAPDASRSSVLAKKLQLMNAAIGGTAVAKLPMSKADYNKSQLAGIEMAEEGEENPVLRKRTGKLKPVNIVWKKAKSGRYYANATADLLEWYERGGTDRTALQISVFKGDEGNWIATAEEPYEAEEFAPEGVNDIAPQPKKEAKPTPQSEVEATATEQPKALKGKEKIGEGVDILASAIGAKKNFTPEQKPDILKGLRLIAEGIAEELGVKGKELYAKLKEKLSELGYKDIADNLDSIKDEIRDDFKDVEPPKQEPPKAENEKSEGEKVTSIGKRLAMTMPELMDDANLQYTPDRWDAVIKKTEAFLSDLFYDSKGKPLSKVEVLKNAKEVLDMINSINFGSASEMGGTLPMFMLIYMRGVAKQTNNTEMQRLVEYQMAQTSRMAGQVIASMRALVENVGRAAEAATLADGVIRETLAKATENGIQDLNETIEALTEALKLKQSEIDTLNKALKESESVAKAEKNAKKSIAGKKRPAPEPTTEAGKIRRAIREKRAAMLEKYGKKINVGFAALNDERKQYIKDLIDIIVDYAKLGIESPKEFVQEFLDLWEKGTGESGDALWADIMGDPDFQAKEQEAKLDWVAKKVQGAIERAIKGQNPKATNQDKMLNAIARALVSQVRSQNKPTNKPDTKLEDAVEVIKNRELTAESADRAMNLVKASIETMKDSAGNPLSQTQKDALLLQAEDLISAMTTDGLPMAVIRSEIAKGLKSLGTSMRELAVAHYSEQQDAVNNIRQTLEDKLVGLGLSRTDAANYADAVQAEFMAKLGEAQIKKVQSIMNPTKKQAENELANMLARAYNAGGVNAVDAIFAKRNLGTLTNAEINALGNAQNNDDVKAVFDKKIKDERVQAYLNRARKSTKTTVSQDLLKYWNEVKGAKDAVAAMVKRAKGSNIELTQEDIDVLESGDIDAITSMFEEKVAVKELMTAYGRKADGSKRTRPARKNTIQKMLELIEAGMVNGETARNLFAEKFGLGSLTEVDTEFITNAFEQLQFFKSGEIAAIITKDIEDYMEAVKIKAGGVPRLMALQTAISNMIIKSALTGFGSMTGAITQGTIVGNMLGIPAHTIASKIRSKMAVKAAMEVVKDQFKGVVMSDIINTMKTGIPSLESKAMKERFDAGGGDVFDYLTKAVDNMEIDGVKSLLQWLMLKPTTQFYKLSRYTIAADLIGTHPVSELLTAQMLFENAVENEYGGIAPEQGSDAWKNLISAIQDKMGYNKMAEFNAIIDEEIKQAKVIGIPLDSGYRVRRQKALATEQRDAAIVEWAMDTARSMQLQENPKDGFIGGVVNALRGFKLSEKWAKKMPVSVGYGLAASMLLFRTSVFLLPRIMMVAARAITYGTPVVGTGLALRGLIKADTRGASIRYGALLTINIASLAYLTAGVLSMLDLDDDDEDETEVKFAGLKLKIKKSPPVSFYGEDISEWNKEPLKIKVGDEMIARPEVAIQFGNRRPLTMRYAPWFLVNHVLLSKILEKAQYAVVDVNKVTGEKTVELQSISLADLGGAVISALGAGTLDIAFENLDRVARNAKGVFGKEESQIVKDRAYTDLMYTAMNPIKLALRPKALQEVSLSIGKGLSVLKGEDYKEQKPTNMVEAAVKDLGFGLITPFNDIMDTYNYDEYGMSRPKTLSAPKGINSWISVVDNIVADTPRLPENWDSEYAEQRANGRLPKISEGRSVAIPMVDFKSTMMQPQHFSSKKEPNGMKDYTIEQRAEINRMIRLMQSDVLLDADLQRKSIKELDDEKWKDVIKYFKGNAAIMAIETIKMLHVEKYGSFVKNKVFTPLPFDVELIRKANDKLEKEVMQKNLK